MKKTTVLITLILLISTSLSFSQEKKEETKEALKPALLVIDIQNAYLQMIPEREKEVAMYMINMYIDLFHSKGYPVIRIYHHSDTWGPHPGSEEFEFPASVRTLDSDPKVIKTYPDAFNKTGLDQVLKETNSNTLFLTGLSAIGCVLATWIGANDHDYDAFLVKEAIMSHNSEYTNQVEDMFDAVSYDVIKLILDNAE